MYASLYMSPPSDISKTSYRTAVNGPMLSINLGDNASSHLLRPIKGTTSVFFYPAAMKTRARVDGSCTSSSERPPPMTARLGTSAVLTGTITQTTCLGRSKMAESTADVPISAVTDFIDVGRCCHRAQESSGQQVQNVRALCIDYPFMLFHNAHVHAHHVGRCGQKAYNALMICSSEFG
ncbi:hypothetical protein BC628DRAFT_1386715 [Trametes gibbosa]|nr:hypothetical protein BC628DRAFT_1386715 [Trametes gibbosa]